MSIEASLDDGWHPGSSLLSHIYARGFARGFAIIFPNKFVLKTVPIIIRKTE